ncbi:MAG: hypothetical protein WAL98_13350 [Desulfatiglandaceae bacterium]
MAREKEKNETPTGMQAKLLQLEALVARKGVHLHYDRLEAAGLKLKGGICKIRGEHHLFIDRRKSPAERVDILKDCLTSFPPTEAS